MNARPVLAAACALLLLAGCERQMHDMYRQPRYDRDTPSPIWHDQRADRPPVAGTVAAASGDLAGTSSGRRGTEVPKQWQEAREAATPPPMTKALLVRGQERYAIYCVPCHSPLGDGDGPVARHGFPHPPSYHDDRLRNASDRYLFDVITNGYGIMYGYADRVNAQDRWAIVGYLRALQMSQNAKAAQLPPDVLGKLPP
jgi:mono/diheme cytochrome c family protein